MKDDDCVHFLQWALPQLHMRWPGFRKVRKQVCKRISQRLKQLQLTDADAYRRYLAHQTNEWRILDTLCRVTISRFYRDKLVFTKLSEEILPALAEQIQTTEEKTLRCWSIGCASGEEPYTLAILWRHCLAQRFPDLAFNILATDADPHLLQRCRHACYPFSSIKNLPEAMRSEAFTQMENKDEYCLNSEYINHVGIQQQDIRETMPEENFHLILCRNLAFTYFDEKLQQRILHELHAKLWPEGWLVLGVHEKLPEGQHYFSTVSTRLGLYQRIDETL